jgi:type III pantothenate kinase
MSARALENATDLLPYVPLADVQRPPNALGKSTEQAIRGGLYWGALGAVRQLIEQAADELSCDSQGAAPHVLLTGGDGPWLQSQLKGQSVFERHLVLAGIALMAASLPR